MRVGRVFGVRVAAVVVGVVLAGVVVAGVGVPGGARWSGAGVRAGGGRAMAAVSAHGTAQAGVRAGSGPVAGALVAARRLGRRVEVVSLRTETSQVFVNPRGSVTVVEYAQPVRVRAGGSWVPVDTRLRVRADGTVGPVAADGGLRLSGGGAGPLAVLADGPRRVAVSWPGRLPVPVLSGDSAVYRGVLPGVDLRVAATVDGFTEVLVVRDRAAAADPRLARIRLAMATTGVRLKAGAGGGLAAVDGRGRAVFTAGRPVMWDSAGGRAGVTTVAMGLRVGRGEVTVVPDRGMLAGRGTRFPVFIDPAVSLGLTSWGNVVNVAPNQTMAQDPPALRSQGAKAGDTCDANGCYVYRSGFAFGLGGLYGKHILAATFGITMAHSWSCSPTPTQLWLTSAVDVNSSTWNNLGWLAGLDTQSAAANSATCGQPPVWMVFSGGLAGQVQAGANAGWPTISLGLKAPDETTTTDFKRFDANAVLSVTYNSIPSPPDSLTVDGKPCVTGASRPYIADLTPTLTAHVSDPDPADLLGIRFAGAPLGGTLASWAAQDNLANGGTANIKVPAGILSDRGVYTFQAYTTDYTDNSGWSGACEFAVAATPPGAPAITSADYPNDQAFHGVVGRTGWFTLTAPASHPEDVAAYKYGFNACNQPTCATTVIPDANHNATIPYTPMLDGPNNLFVWALNKAGLLSTEVTYQFSVHSATFTSPVTGQQAGAPAAQWLLNEGAGTTAADSTGDGNTATLGGAPTWINPGRLGHGPALSFGSQSPAGWAGTAGAVMNRNPDTGARYPVRTDRSFTVMAWLRMNSLANWATAVAIGGSEASGLYLVFDPHNQRLALMMPHSDTVNPATSLAYANSAPQVGAWEHVAGVFDAATDQMTLYVNGVPQGTATDSTPWNATGPLLIGYGTTDGGPSARFPGDVSDVRLYDRVLSAPEITAIVNTPALAGDWELGDGTGTTAHDTSGVTPPDDGALTGGTAWVPVNPADARPSDGGLPPGPTALSLDYATYGRVETSKPAIDTAQSFSVAAWVRLTRTDTQYADVVSQDGTTSSGFDLQYVTATNRWAFSINTSDGGPAQRLYSSAPPAVGTWTHLAAVYDVVTGQMRLYVDGVLDTVTTRSTAPWTAAGPLAIGRALWNGGKCNRWPGDIASVQVYAGVLSNQQIANLAGV